MGRNFEHKRFLHTAAFTQRSRCADQLLHSGLFSQSSVYAEQLLHTEALTQRGRYTEKLLRTEVFKPKLYTEKLLHREASKQIILYTQKHLHTQKLYIHTVLLHTDACTHRSLFTELTDRRFDAERPLHRAAFAHRRPQAFTHRSFYT